MIGETISHYRLLEKLGAGGMGIVYAAEDLKLGRKVALKFLANEYSRDPVALHRFEREARSISALNHPNICTIYDIDECDGQRFMAMELLKGMTLKDCIAREMMPLDRLLDYACQAVAGLEAAHAEGIVHRDIKPANIFVTMHGYVKLLDFGLAKLSATQRGAMETAVGTTMAAEMVAREDLTMPGSAIGTVAYMSPEQALGEPLDGRTDLFSFGAVLYQMATGHQPFVGNTSAGTIDAILHKAPAPVLALNPGMPPELQAIISKALEKDRTLRYQSATDLRIDLQRIRRDSQSSPSATVTTHPLAQAASAPSASASSASAPVASQPSLALPEAPKPKNDRMPLILAGVLLAIVALAALATWWRIANRPLPVAHLHIQGRPGAQLLIDQKPSGVVGQDGTLHIEVPPGQHAVQLNLPGYEPYSTNVVIDQGESENLIAEMKPVAASPPLPPPVVPAGDLIVQSNVAGADILVDGQLKGFTTSDKTTSIELNAGSHQVQIKKAGYKDSPEQAVEIHAKQQNQLAFKLEASNEAGSGPAGSYLIVKGEPGAEVRIDGNVAGVVAKNGSFPAKLDPGEHVVQVSLSGYEPYSGPVNVKPGGKTYMVAAMKASAPVVSSFTASQSKITPGQTAKLAWTTQNATEVHIDQGIGAVSVSGTRDVTPAKSTTYMLIANGKNGSTTAKTSITVEADQADLQAINETLALFKGAYDSMDVAALRRQWPTLTQTQSDALKTIFLGLTSVRLNDDCPGSPVISGDTATWTCSETISYKGGSPIPDVHNSIVFHFKRMGGRWRIDRRDHAQ